MSKSWGLSPAAGRPAASLLRDLAALLLQLASGALACAAGKLQSRRAPDPYLPEMEFHELHSESGAPEGALYIDGKLVAILPMSRL